MLRQTEHDSETLIHIIKYHILTIILRFLTIFIKDGKTDGDGLILSSPSNYIPYSLPLNLFILTD